MGANKTEKAIQRMSKAAGEQSVKDYKRSIHSHKSSSDDEKKISADLKKVKPFSLMPGRSYESFTGVSSNPLEDFNDAKFGEWLQRHQKNIAVHFPTVGDGNIDDAA